MALSGMSKNRLPRRLRLIYLRNNPTCQMPLLMTLEMFWFAAILIGIFAIFLIIFGSRRYSYAINPLFQFAIFDIGVLTILSAVVANVLNEGEIVLAPVLYLSIVYTTGFFLIFLPRRFALPRRLFNSLINLVGSDRENIKYSWIRQCILIATALGLYILLMWSSGAGSLWLTDPRLAYQIYRVGVGYIYVMVQWSFLLSLLYYLWTKKPKLTGLIFSLCIYSLLAYFTGSKSNILSGLVLVGIYYNFKINKIPNFLIFISPFVMLTLFLTLLLLQDSFGDLVAAVSYFRDYTETTGLFLSRIDEFEPLWGYGLLSDLWFYVPRSLFPQKPFEYGIVLIHQILFPGAAEMGATPGMLPWAIGYLDFRIVGVFFSGLFTGFIRRGAYESFLSHRRSIFAFILMIQLSLMPIYAYATVPLICIIGIFFSLFCYKKIV